MTAPNERPDMRMQRLCNVRAILTSAISYTNCVRILAVRGNTYPIVNVSEERGFVEPRSMNLVSNLALKRLRELCHHKVEVLGSMPVGVVEYAANPRHNNPRWPPH